MPAHRVGDPDEVRAEWVTTVGAPTAVVVEFTRRRAGTREWLQADFTTWSAAQYQFALTASGNEWFLAFTWPASAAGYIVNVTTIPTTTSPFVIGDSEEVRVTFADLDDNHGQAT